MGLRAARWILAAAALAAAASLLRTALERRAAPVPQKRERPAAGVPAALDSRELKILHFYAPRIPERGKPFTICYGVLNARRVELDPPIAELSPSINRCVEARLDRSARLVLRAYNEAGESVSAAFDLPVKEPAPEILFVDVSPRELRRGDRFTLCYGVRFATRVRVEPGGFSFPASEKYCATWFPAQAPARLIAESPGGAVEAALPVRMAGPGP